MDLLGTKCYFLLYVILDLLAFCNLKYFSTIMYYSKENFILIVFPIFLPYLIESIVGSSIWLPKIPSQQPPTLVVQLSK